MTDTTSKAVVEEPAPESQIVTRAHACDCGGTIQQRGVKSPLGLQVIGWLPLRCTDCQQRLNTAQERENAHRRDLYAGEVRREALKLLDVPPLYASASLGGFQLHGTPEQRQQLSRIKEVSALYLASWPAIPEEHELLLFRGHYGSGKGHIAWSIARALAVGQGAKVRVVKLAAVIRDIREAWRDTAGPSEDQRLEKYRKLDLVIIDEVSRHAFYGKEVKQHLYDIIDDRIEQHRPTILTTNEDPAGIAEILGPALMSRLNGAGGVLQFPEVDWRARMVDAPETNGGP